MIRNFRELTRSSSNAGIVGDVDFEERWLSAVLRDRVRCYTSCATIPRSYEDVKTLGHKLTRDLMADPFVCSCDQRCLHLL